MLRRMQSRTWKATLGGLCVAVAGLIAWPLAWGTPPVGFSSSNIAGPIVMDEIDTESKIDDHEVKIKTKGLSDVYMTEFTIVPGGHGGWHSHPGPSFIAVKSGTLTLYDDCDDILTPHVFPAGTGLAEDAECVHLVANEGDTDLVFVVFQIVPLGAPRRIDEPAP